MKNYTVTDATSKFAARSFTTINAASNFAAYMNSREATQYSLYHGTERFTVVAA